MGPRTVCQEHVSSAALDRFQSRTSAVVGLSDFITGSMPARMGWLYSQISPGCRGRVPRALRATPLPQHRSVRNGHGSPHFLRISYAFCAVCDVSVTLDEYSEYVDLHADPGQGWRNGTGSTARIGALRGGHISNGPEGGARPCGATRTARWAGRRPSAGRGGNRCRALRHGEPHPRSPRGPFPSRAPSARVVPGQSGVIHGGDDRSHVGDCRPGRTWRGAGTEC
jgi:hypothetical protein